MFVTTHTAQLRFSAPTPFTSPFPVYSHGDTILEFTVIYSID